MSLGSTCLICRERITDDETSQCRECGRELHDRCTDYYQTFDCHRCGDELWVGAFEF